ncbi:MAG: hypothetical protein Q8L74_03715 [Nitrospirota bacterium]|nr:hypothetical protein [Nitrospirota bacterium]MDP2381164.1 hypothetical protein [Nitrospirota bacterium]MDP3595861.1 hypothetical protein [Nitrospirota bacterium]
MDFNGEPKNRKVSIHNKYKRRLRNLSHAIDQYLQMAEIKLDKSQSGSIHNRAEIEKIVDKTKELAAMLPSKSELISCPPVRDDFFEVLERTAGDTEKIIAEANEFFKGLTEEDWAEMRNSFKERT